MMENNDESGITVGELIEQLRLHPAENPVCFGPSGDLSFYRVKDRGGVTQVEFNEIFSIDYRPGE